MKKLALSFCIVAAAVGYVWQEQGALASSQLDAELFGGTPSTAPLLSPASEQGKLNQIVFHAPISQSGSTLDSVPIGFTNVAALRAAGSGYVDGNYTGPSVDAYYGLVQIQAFIKGGRLSGIRVLQYPSHRQTSVAINHRALPMLRSEVITAQSAQVDIVSGATLTSEAFIQSLGGALSQAR